MDASDHSDVIFRETETGHGCYLVAAYDPSNMTVYLRTGSVEIIVLYTRLRQKLQIKLVSPSHSIPTLGQPVLALPHDTRRLTG